jgi:hypothetical protein
VEEHTSINYHFLLTLLLLASVENILLLLVH